MIRNVNYLNESQEVAKVSISPKFIKLFIGILILTFSWSLMIPLFAGPDEHSNFIKSAAVVRGELTGMDIPATPTMSYWSTYVDIDPLFGTALAVPSCFIFASEKPACDVPIGSIPTTDAKAWTQMGRYPPISFAIAGLGTVFGANDLSTFASRFAIGLTCAFFLAAAIYSRQKRDQTSIGFLAAITPGVLFISSMNSPSGTEICSAIAIWTLLPLLLSGNHISKFEMFVLGSAGILLTGSRPLGFVMFAIILTISAFLNWNYRQHWKSILQHRFFLISQAVFFVFSIFWFRYIYSFQTGEKVVDGMRAISRERQILTVFSHIPNVIEQAFGNYGWLDSPSPQLATYLGLGFILFVIGKFWGSNENRAKFAMLLILGTTLVFCFLIDLQMYSMLRAFGLQGRHIMPLLVGIPILVTQGSLYKARTEYWAGGLWAVLMIWCGMSALRRYSVGINGQNALEMFRDPTRSPGIGLKFSLLLLVSATAIATFFIVRVVNQTQDNSI
jgi:hypothetical protein